MSSRASDRSEALRIAAEFEDVARRKRTVRQVQDVIQDLHRRITGDELPITTMRRYASLWLDQKSAGSAPSTLTFYRGCVEKFIRFLGTEADRGIQEMTKQHLERFRASDSAAGLAAKTVNHEIKCLKMLFKSARRDCYLQEDPSEFVDTLRERADTISARRPFSMEELNALGGVFAIPLGNSV